MTEADEETFCIYCQREYASPKSLRTHVLKKHSNTYRAHAYRDRDEFLSISASLQRESDYFREREDRG